MITLAIDTSAGPSVAFIQIAEVASPHAVPAPGTVAGAGVGGGAVPWRARVLAERTDLHTRKHAEFVGLAIRELQEEIGLPVGGGRLERAAGGKRLDCADGEKPGSAARHAPDLRPDRVVVGVGPGPFTGLRAGIAAGIGYGVGAGIPVVGVRSHDAIAYTALLAGVTGQLVVATDARRKEVYATTYLLEPSKNQSTNTSANPSRAGAKPSRAGARVIAGPGVFAPADLHIPAGAHRAGLGFDLYPDVLGAPTLTGEGFTNPSAGALGCVATTGPGEVGVGGGDDLGALWPPTPLYLREPDAQPRRA